MTVLEPLTRHPAAPSAPFAQEWDRDRLARQLQQLGLRRGVDVLVHSSMRAVGRVAGGPGTVLDAVRDVIGPRATVVVPTQTPGNSVTSAVHLRSIAGMTERQIEEFRQRQPPFVAADSPSVGMGIFAEHVRCHSQARRSAHPITSFAALGPRAAQITAVHPMECHLGEESPLGALSKYRAQVLLLGVGYEKTTVFHLAEYRIGASLRTYHSKVLAAGRPEGVWAEYEGIRLDDSDFGQIGREMAQGRPWVRTGEVGSAFAACFPVVEAVRFAVEWMRRHRKS